MSAEPSDRPPLSAAEVCARVDRPELTVLWQALRGRFESGRTVSRVRVGPLDDDQRAALGDLLGLRRLPGEHVWVAVERLDEALREMTGHDARAVVEIVTGRLGNRAADRLADQRARAELWAWLAEHRVVRACPALDAWVAKVHQVGLIDGSTARTRGLLERALTVLDALPADGVPLSTFAQQTCQDTHALDSGLRLPTLVLKAVAVIHQVPEPVDAEQRRALWEHVGVAYDPLSSVVFVAGLRPDGAGPLARMLRAWAGAGEACSVTLAQLRCDTTMSVPAGRVWIVENPAILTMAVARFGGACPPLVCTAGWPSSAAIRLLRLLRDNRADLLYHGDFDGDGLRIAAHVYAKAGARPWRMSAHDYLSAVPAYGLPAGRVTDAPWDERLAPAVTEHGIAVPEEHVASTLLADLSAAVASGGG